jgi:hypothetical protein
MIFLLIEGTVLILIPRQIHVLAISCTISGRTEQAFLDAPSVTKCLTFDFFDTNFYHLYYIRYFKIKNQI